METTRQVAADVKSSATAETDHVALRNGARLARTESSSS